ncbi:MAG: hybrid sensor histidine kinase/response regulator transcription factor [Phocaeicola sp.]
MKRIRLLIIFIVSFALHTFATPYRCIDTSNGLSSKRIISIEKDEKGYMWFLTHEGADRYDGKELTHYPLIDNGLLIHPSPIASTFLKGSNGTIWEVGLNGRLFEYNIDQNEFQVVHRFPSQTPTESSTPISKPYIDKSDQIWYFEGNNIHIYKTDLARSFTTPSPSFEAPSAIVETDKENYYIATKEGIFRARWSDNELIYQEPTELKEIKETSFLYFDEEHQILVIGTFDQGTFLYDLKKKKVIALSQKMSNIHISKIIENQYDHHELFLATIGAGVHKINLESYQIENAFPPESPIGEQLNRTVVRDLFFDESGNIWFGCYLKGIFIHPMDTPKHTWIRQNPNNPNSLVNNHITKVLEDSDGDIWFSTFDGVCCYFTQTKEWKKVSIPSHSFLPLGNHIILSICEESPGKFLAGGYMSKLYTIEKRNMTFSETPWFHSHERMNQSGHYIRSILKDNNGTIWIGGFPYLVRYEPRTQQSTNFMVNEPIYRLTQKDSSSIWVGTSNGLLLLDIEKQQLKKMELIPEIGHINDIFQDVKEEKTYIGTLNQGFISYNNTTNKVTQYKDENTSLNSNNIYCIVPNMKEELLLSTEKGISIFNTTERTFANWKEEEGLGATNFSQAAGTRTQRGEIIFGGVNGAILLSDTASFTQKKHSKMVFNDFYILYQKVIPGKDNSPLSQHIDNTQKVILNHDQNIFSLVVGSVNFENASSILYSWKLDNFYEKWTTPSTNKRIQYMNLKPGSYKLRVRALSKENKHVLEERHLDIHIKDSFWTSWTGWVIYLSFLSLAGILLTRYLRIEKDREASKDKIQFFTNTAHDILTPLTLIKTPLNELLIKEELSEWGKNRLKVAIQSTENLADLTRTFINSLNKENSTIAIHVADYELNEYLKSCITPFEAIACQKEITISIVPKSGNIQIWIDKNKMNYILRNLLISIIKQTTKGGEIRFETEIKENEWIVTIHSTPPTDAPKAERLFYKQFFKNENEKVTEEMKSGMTILTTTRLVKKHAGNMIIYNQKEEQISIKLSFPITSPLYEYNAFVKTVRRTENENAIKLETETTIQKPTLLLVENNEDLRIIIADSLSEEFQLREATNTTEAVEKIKIKQPDIIVSDIKMPELDGYTLCKQLKENIETSHIPVILLTTETNNESMLIGLKNKADKCIVKPFDMQLLKANIHNILENKEIQRKAFSKMQIASLSEIDKEADFDIEQLFMIRVTEAIKESIHKELNVDNLCSTLNMSRSSFYTKIKALTNQSPSEFIRSTKMKRAEELLKSKRYTVAEIADMTGFSDPKYFTDIFKKYYGLTPSAYMKQH